MKNIARWEVDLSSEIGRNWKLLLLLLLRNSRMIEFSSQDNTKIGLKPVSGYRKCCSLLD